MATRGKPGEWFGRIELLYSLCRGLGMSHADAFTDVARGLERPESEIERQIPGPAPRPAPVSVRRSKRQKGGG